MKNLINLWINYKASEFRNDTLYIGEFKYFLEFHKNNC